MRYITLLLLLGIVWLVACAKPEPGTQIVTATDPLHDIKQTVRTKFPTVQQLSTKELEAWLQDANRAQPLLLDARAPEEFAVSHLRSAHPMAQMEAVLQEYPKDQPIVNYCSVGYRSSALSEKLMQRGFTKVYNLEGSIFQWANEGRPIYQGEQSVKQVHPYDAKWGQMLRPELRAPLP